jgi:hypothetical protein
MDTNFFYISNDRSRDHSAALGPFSSDHFGFPYPQAIAGHIGYLGRSALRIHSL